MAVIAPNGAAAREPYPGLCLHPYARWRGRSRAGHTFIKRSTVQYRPTRSELAHLVNQARLDRHISIRSAGRIAGVPAATVQGWLAGRHFSTPALRPRFLLLVEALGLTDHLHAAL